MESLHPNIPKISIGPFEDMAAWVDWTFPSRELTSGVRWLAAMVVLGTLPLVLVGVLFFWTLIPLPGLLIFYFLWMMASGRLRHRSALLVWSSYCLYAIFITLILALGNVPLALLLIPLSFGLGTGLLGIRMLLDGRHQREWEALSEYNPNLESQSCETEQASATWVQDM